MGLSEGAVSSPAETSAPAEVASVAAEPAAQKAPEKRAIVPLKWGQNEVAPRVDENDDRSPIERLTDSNRDSSGRFKSKSATAAQAPDQGATAPATEQAPPEAGQTEVTVGGKKFKDSKEALSYAERVIAQAGRTSATEKRANAAEARLKQALEVVKQYEEFVRGAGLVDDAGVATGKRISSKESRDSRVDPGEASGRAERAAADAGVPASLIDAIDWDVVHRFGQDPQLGVPYAIAAALKAAEGVWAAREKRLQEQIEAKFQADLGYVSEVRQAHEGTQAAANFIVDRAKSDINEDGSLKYPELTADNIESVREFVTKLVPIMDRMGERAFTPDGFEDAVYALRGRLAREASRSTGIPRRPAPSQAQSAQARATAAAVGGGEGGGIGPAVQATNPAALLSQRIRAADQRTSTGWKFAS